MRIVPFALLLLLPACGGRPTLSDTGKARLAAHAAPASWEDLDPARPGTHLRDPRTGVTFVRIDAGEFTMGSNRLGESPPHRVQLTRPYLMAETELTVGQWQRWVHDFAGDPDVPVPAGPDTMPMQASWNDAVAFCQTFGYRLPTEAEWERAALGGQAGDDPQWLEVAAVEARGWVHTNGSRPVRQKLPNGFGLYDTIGNLAEWCSDFLCRDYRDRPDPDVDPQGPATGQAHMLRGGSWYTLPRPQPQTRTFGGADERNGFYGFRPARSL